MVDHPKQAFPFQFQFKDLGPYDLGMTLRDYVAAAALQGMLANPYVMRSSIDKIVHDSHKFADAMLTERAKETP